MSDFIDKRGDIDVQSVGPFETWPVMVNGWTVPNLQTKYTAQGVTLTLDNRFDLDLPTELAGFVIGFIANVTAVALGWSCHPTSHDWEPPAGFRSSGDGPSRTLPWSRLIGIETDDKP